MAFAIPHKVPHSAQLSYWVRFPRPLLAHAHIHDDLNEFGFIGPWGRAVGCVRSSFMQGRKSAALASIPAGLLFLFGILDRVTDLKVGPSSLEARLTQKISDADRIIDQLKDFAVENAKLLIDVRENSHGLMVDNADVWAEADAYKKSVLEMLRRMGVSRTNWTK